MRTGKLVNNDGHITLGEALGCSIKFPLTFNLRVALGSAPYVPSVFIPAGGLPSKMLIML